MATTFHGPHDSGLKCSFYLLKEIVIEQYLQGANGFLILLFLRLRDPRI